MKRLCPLLVLLLPSLAQAGGEWAVLRITSHGCSGTVIYADDAKSLVLTCAHMFLAPPRYDGEPDRIDPNMLARSFTFDAPHPAPGVNPRPGIRLLKYDVGSDLALIQVNARLPYVCPVGDKACPGNAASVGYDLMQWPAVVRPATIRRVDGLRQYTLERPRPGRSGGPLLACGGTCVVGVCTGYTGPTNNLEVVRGGEGIYVSHGAILKFLGMPAGVPLAPVPATPVPAGPAVPRPTDAQPVILRPLLPHEIAAGGRHPYPWELPDPNWKGPPPGAPTVRDYLTPECPCGPNCPCPPGVCPNCPQAGPRVCPGGT